MNFQHAGKNINLPVKNTYVAGWTGRNRDAVDHHINELAELGISPPSQVPLYYRVSSSLLTQEDQLQLLGNDTSGEVEPFIVQTDNEIFIGLASDHTDRKLEAYSVAASKQACPKPVSTELWSLDSVMAHIDTLILRCSIKEDNQWVIYQEGTLENISPISDLIAGARFGNNDAMLCGTLTAIGGVRPATEYNMELADPVLNRKIALNYVVQTLPVIT